MIECPICHVQNDNRSLFCAECGQRFAPTSSQIPAAPANSDARSVDVVAGPGKPPERPQFKLRSPFLDGAFADEEVGNLKGGKGAFVQPPEANTPPPANQHGNQPGLSLPVAIANKLPLGQGPLPCQIAAPTRGGCTRRCCVSGKRMKMKYPRLQAVCFHIARLPN